MSLLVLSGETYETGETGTATNTGKAPIWVCDCCLNRRQFTGPAAADTHETGSFNAMSPADMGIYVGLGEELSDYLPGYQR